MPSLRNSKCKCGSGKKYKVCCMDKIAVAKKEMQDLVYHDEEYKKSLMERIKTWNKEAWWNRQHWIKKLYIHIKTKIMEVRNGKSRFQNSNSSNDK